MPDHIAVGGDGNAFIHEAELRIKADELFLAGEHDALAPGGFRVGANLTQNTGSTAFVPMGRGGDDAEYHLPRTLRRVKMGVIVHLIGEVGHIGDEAVDESFHLAALVQQPETVRVDSHTPGDALPGCPSAGG